MQAAIVTLTARDRVRVQDHLLRLAPEDRSLRFAAGLVTDDTVRRYAAAIAFERDLVVGLIDAVGAVIGLAHGCVFDVRGRRHVEAAFSVDAGWRGRGFGVRLMQALTTQVQAAGGAVLVGSCAARNLPMRRLFERAGLALERVDDELNAYGLIGAAAAAAAAALTTSRR